MMTKNEQRLHEWLPDDPDLVRIVARLMADVATAPEAVEPGEASVIAVITLTVQHTPRLIPQQVERALHHGISVQHVLEAIYQLVPVVGLPRGFTQGAGRVAGRAHGSANGQANCGDGDRDRGGDSAAVVWDGN